MIRTESVASSQIERITAFYDHPAMGAAEIDRRSGSSEQ